MDLADRLKAYYGGLQIDVLLSKGITAMNPYRNPESRKYSSLFFQKYYSDNRPRALLIGINPGRFGAGVTGVMFTDPVRLQSVCGIESELPKRPELSSVFIYEMIAAYGTAEEFYGNFLFAALSPLGFLRDGKNLNYYDVPELREGLEGFMVESIRSHLSMGADHRKAFVLGMGQNAANMQRLNQKYRFFEELVPLPHPRWIMQYRLKRKNEFVGLYLSALQG
jgi:hypothetical protein